MLMEDGLYACRVDALTTDTPDVPTLIVVLGMHRGGTSVVVRAMETMGATLGDRLGAPVAGENDKGFFEDLDIVALNEAVLAAAGSSWHTLAPIELDKIDALRLNALRAQAVEVLRDKCRNGMFALKDPRLSRLLPFWQSVFDQLYVNIAYVIAVRNPTSVMRSLHKRDNFSAGKAYPLWLAHMVPALRATQGKLRVLIEYDQLLDAPRSELARISAHLGLALDPERARAFESEFLDRSLRHWRSDARENERAHSVPRQIGALFNVLRLVGRPGHETQQARLETALTDAETYLDGIAPAACIQDKGPARLIASLFGRLAAIRQALRRRMRAG